MSDSFFFQADERFQEESNRAYISKWLRKSIRQYDNFEKSLEGLKSFFREVKVPSFSMYFLLHLFPSWKIQWRSYN